MMPALRRDRLIERLPQVRGRLMEDAPLAPIAWFRAGGPAEVMFQPADRDDLAEFLAALAEDVPVTVFGVGSNLLVRDGGVPGVVIRLGRPFAGISADGMTVAAGGAAMDVNVARAACDAGIAGLEFLSGIPGTVGGALRMNAGAYERETADVFVAAEAVDRAGRLHRPDAAAMGFSYRHTKTPEDWIFTAATLRGAPGDRDGIAARMTEIKAARQDSQPIRSRTGGSTFKNPPGSSAWKLIDEAGCRGLRRGAAQVSEIHCNFLINTGGATAAELEGLGEDVRARVRDHAGVTLEWEIRRIGVPLPGGAP
ncbi:MAG: UDP-N-acetylmuramate dehydrogenase [Alphaproteobacteria bacterium]|nr:UDP-N-acetylmuramate dehydrogenase [Alphaproteobacteria bacterium]